MCSAITDDVPPPLLVRVADALSPELAAVNARSLAEQREWILVSALGLGPRFVPGVTGCWECLAVRLRANGVPAGAPAALDERLAAVLPAGVLLDASLRSHALVRIPDCPACGPFAASLTRSAVVDEAQPGSLRAVPIEATLARLAPLASPLTGLAGDPVEQPAPGAHVFTVRASIPEHPRRAAGKGATAAHARVSALAEALEHYSGVARPGDTRRVARLADLEDAIDPRRVMLFSDAQIESRERWNAAGTMSCRVPEPFDEEAPIEWTPLRSISRERVRWLPSAMCWYRAVPSGRRQILACSNGCATGNTFDEALLHALLELVERDAVSMWWSHRVPRPAIDLARSPVASRIADALASAGRRAWALDLTHDLGVPVVAALSSASDGSRVLLGFGAHVDPGIALVRAATELAQVESNHAGGRGSEPFRRWWNDESLRTQPWLEGFPGTPSHEPAPHLSIAGALSRVRAAIEHPRSGLEILVLDQTRAETRLHTVRAVVPGLRHFWPRFAPGRLYDVPLSLGWISAPRGERDLNPIPMFL